eukprot:g31027.t1
MPNKTTLSLTTAIAILGVAYGCALCARKWSDLKVKWAKEELEREKRREERRKAMKEGLVTAAGVCIAATYIYWRVARYRRSTPDRPSRI